MKQLKDFIIVSNQSVSDDYTVMQVAPADESELPPMLPGQFVEIAVESTGVFLRRPISINDVDKDSNILQLLIRKAGKGTEALLNMNEGDRLNILLPLGNGFTTAAEPSSKMLLIGGGVGVAPLLYLGKVLNAMGHNAEFLLGARKKSDLLLCSDFETVGPVHYATEDGSKGIKGLVTQHPVLKHNFDRYYCCGPAPMMKAVAAIARDNCTDCEVSLENMMACGLGACLCCVEKTVKGNVCVCTDGPVFNIKSLTW